MIKLEVGFMWDVGCNRKWWKKVTGIITVKEHRALISAVTDYGKNIYCILENDFREDQTGWDPFIEAPAYDWSLKDLQKYL